jgi:HlyD family secretion protein
MPISRNRKMIMIPAVILGLVTIVVLSKSIQTKEGQPVQTGRVDRLARLESKVTASGEIRPVQFYDLTAEVNGRVEQLYVNEGDTVKKGQPLVRVDTTIFALQSQGAEANVRVAAADANNARVALQSAENEVNQARSNLSVAEADLEKANASFRFQENEYNRNLQLVEGGVISKSSFDSVKSQLEQGQAAVKSQEARVRQLKQQLQDAQLAVARAAASLKSAEERVKSNQSGLDLQNDQLKRTTKFSPIDGVVSSLPVRVGMFAIANFQSTPLLTVADMSQINAEIKVDETDIASVAIGHPAKIKVDALGDVEIKGTVVEKAASAITRSGQTISQSSGGSQEAKDFVVKVRLDPTPEIRLKLRPGMSATAVITTATVEDTLAIPLQAIVPREIASGDTHSDRPSASGITHKKEVEGVFLLTGKNGHVRFTPVETGIKGEQDIEVKNGLSEKDEIVVGPYKTLRSLKDGDPVTREARPEGTDKPK